MLVLVAGCSSTAIRVGDVPDSAVVDSAQDTSRFDADLQETSEPADTLSADTFAPDTYVADAGPVDSGPPVCMVATNLGTLALNCNYTQSADVWCSQVCAPANKYAYKCEQGAPFKFTCDRMGPYWCCDRKECVRENDSDRHCPASNKSAYNCTGLPFKQGCVKSVNASYPNIACCAQ